MRIDRRARLYERLFSNSELDHGTAHCADQHTQDTILPFGSLILILILVFFFLFAADFATSSSLRNHGRASSSENGACRVAVEFHFEQ